MTPNELTHNADGVHENGRITPLATTKTVTFKVTSGGNIKGGSQHANVGDSVLVKLAKNSTFTGSIYALIGTQDKCNKLVGADPIAVGTTYTIKPSAKKHTFSITTSDDGTATGTNGTLRVGSGGNDDCDDDDHEDHDDDDNDDDDDHGSGSGSTP